MTTRKNEPLRIHKTPLNQRRTYTYNFYIDSKVQKVILHPDKDGVTEELIKKLHAMDDAEVYNNCKNGRPEPTEEEKKQRIEWEKKHPGEKSSYNWNQSLDIALSDEEDSETLGDIIPIPEKAENPDVERLREIVSTMSERQKQVYQLHFIEGFSVKETAAILGMSSPAVDVCKLSAKSGVTVTFLPSLLSRCYLLREKVGAVSFLHFGIKNTAVSFTDCGVRLLICIMGTFFHLHKMWRHLFFIRVDNFICRLLVIDREDEIV